MGKRWAEVKRVLLAVQDLSGAELEETLGRECGNDAELRREIDSYLTADIGRLDYLDEDPPQRLGGKDELDQRIGPYRVLRPLGSGATLVVYQAIRDDGDFQHEVAIKVVRPGIRIDQIEQRFRVERQILADLKHANIITLFDGGSTDDGRPYFVMEYAEGLPIDRYCDQNNLGLVDRLRLFRDVCSAVHVAHEHGVVHRDLKPGNILVTDDGDLRLLDFGIAKILGPDGTTPAAPLPGSPLTPAYASPEQISGAVVTTASDIYSLGVLLYELLTDIRPSRPYDLGSHEGAPREVQPERPSIAAIRGPMPDAQKRQRRLKGDLDAIVLKTLRKKPRQRYRSVDALAEDINLFLQNRPVQAQKATASYLSRKFVQRHQVGVATAALILMLICGSVVALALQQRQTVQERDKFQEIARFLTDLFESADPFKGNPEAVTAEELLDSGARRIDDVFKNEPIVRAALSQTMADSYLNLGLFDPAEDLAKNALEIRKQRLGPSHPEVAESQRTLALVLADKGDFSAAEHLLQVSLTTRQSKLGLDHPDVAETLSSLGFVQHAQANFEEAERFHKEALEIRRRAGDQPNLDVAEDLNFLGLIYKEQRRYREAEAALLESLEVCRSLLGKDHPQAAIRLHNLGLVYREQERFQESETHHREALKILEESLGPKHFAVATTVNMLALFLKAHGRYEESLPLQLRALAIRQEIFGNDHPATTVSLNNLGALYFEMDRLSESEEALREAVRIRKDVLRPHHPSTAISLVNLGKTLLRQEHYEESRQCFEEGIAILESEAHPRLPRSLREYAKWFRLTGDEPQAQAVEDRAAAIEGEKANS